MCRAKKSCLTGKGRGLFKGLKKTVQKKTVNLRLGKGGGGGEGGMSIGYGISRREKGKKHQMLRRGVGGPEVKGKGGTVQATYQSPQRMGGTTPRGIKNAIGGDAKRGSLETPKWKNITGGLRGRKTEDPKPAQANKLYALLDVPIKKKVAMGNHFLFELSREKGEKVKFLNNP